MESYVKEQLNLEKMTKFGGQGGGCLCSGQGYDTDIGQIYVKYCSKTFAESEVIFEGEFASLLALAETKTVRVPAPLKVCKSANTVCLVTQYLDMDSLTKNRELGVKIAELHMHNGRRRKNNVGGFVGEQTTEFVSKFGFDLSTCCGTIPQPNVWTDSWTEFFTREKLKVQIDLIERDSGDRELRDLWAQLVRKLPEMLPADVTPALLHGDLWGGNVAQVEGEPVVFDPSSFYGHSEFDLAIATMFGGFGGAFFDAYFELCPKSDGYERRQKLYQLFHYLNHWNHFGAGYRAQSLSIMKQLVK